MGKDATQDSVMTLISPITPGFICVASSMLQTWPAQMCSAYQGLTNPDTGDVDPRIWTLSFLCTKEQICGIPRLSESDYNLPVSRCDKLAEMAFRCCAPTGRRSGGWFRSRGRLAASLHRAAGRGAYF